MVLSRESRWRAIGNRRLRALRDARVESHIRGSRGPCPMMKKEEIPLSWTAVKYRAPKLVKSPKPSREKLWEWTGNSRGRMIGNYSDIPNKIKKRRFHLLPRPPLLAKPFRGFLSWPLRPWMTGVDDGLQIKVNPWFEIERKT